MPQFHYRARTPAGEEVTGEVSAGNEAWARQSLQSQGLTVLELTILESAPPDERSGTAGSRQLTQEQASTLAEYAGATMSAGLPLEDSLDALGAEAGDRRLERAAHQLAAQLRNGVSLERSLADLGPSLPRPLRGLLTVAVRCPHPAAVFEGFAQQRMATQTAKLQIRSALAYPILIALLLIPLLLFLSAFVIPQFSEMYREFDLALPGLTQVVLRIGHDLPTIILLCLGLPLSILPFSRILGGHAFYHRMRGAVPLFGRLWMWSAQQELAAALSTLTRQRLPLTESLMLAAGMLEDQNLARACRVVGRKSEAGAPLGECMARSIHFDRVLTGLVGWGESHDMLPEALDYACTYFGQRIDQHASMARRVIPSIALTLFALIAFTTFIGLYMPIIKLIEGLT